MTSEVTQEARNAAADLLHEVGCLLGDDGIGQVADLIRDGEYDDHDATIAFAKFERETIARMNAKPSDDKAIMRELRPSKAAMEKIERMEQANAAGLAEIRNMPFGGAAQSGEGRSGAEEDTASLCDKPEWNKHSGGGNPVAPHNLVEIKQRGGDTGIFAAGSLTWKHGAFIWEVLDTVPEADIVAWRLVNPYKLNKALAALNARQSGEGERGQ